MGRSRSRERHRRRSRSRSRSRREDDRDRRHKSSRSYKERPRKRSRSPLPSYSNTAGNSSLIKPAIACSIPFDIAQELTSDEAFDSSHLSSAALKWLEDKVVEQVSERVRDFEELLRDRVAKAKTEMSARLRAQIEQEMKDEVEAIRKREEDSKDRCAAMERVLEQKVKQLEEAEKKLSDERLQMLEVKGKLEMERVEIRKEKEALNKTEQHSILNKGGGMRAPIRLKLGK